MRKAALLLVLGASALLAQEPDSFDVEPPLLIPDRTDSATADASSSEGRPHDVNVRELEKDLERAKRSADVGPHLYRIGVISQVELEQRTLRVVRLEAKLATMRLERATQEAATRTSVALNSETAIDASTKTELAQLTAAAQEANAKRRRLEIEIAETNLQRQLRLLAVGSAHKSDVTRAEEKLAQLKAQQN
jgi:hypothetical protein